jgi:hypothetical protein
MSRMAVVYGQNAPLSYNDRGIYEGPTQASSMNYSRAPPNYSYNSGNREHSPYLVSVGDNNSMQVRRGDNVHVVKKNRYLLEDKNQHSGFQVKLPKLHNYRQSHE